MAKELVFIDWDDTLVNRENAEDFESVTDENNTIYQMSPMFIGAVEAETTSRKISCCDRQFTRRLK